jgi:hypothetical protein
MFCRLIYFCAFRHRIAYVDIYIKEVKNGNYTENSLKMPFHNFKSEI